MALGMREEVDRLRETTGVELAIRVGIDSGPVVAGVIGTAQVQLRRLGRHGQHGEPHGEPRRAGEIQVTERVYELLRGRYELSERGEIEVKGRGPMRTYLLLGRRDEARATSTATDESAPAGGS